MAPACTALARACPSCVGRPFASQLATVRMCILYRRGMLGKDENQDDDCRYFTVFRD